MLFFSFCVLDTGLIVNHVSIPLSTGNCFSGKSSLSECEILSLPFSVSEFDPRQQAIGIFLIPHSAQQPAVLYGAYKRTLAAIRSSPFTGVSGFPLTQSGPLPYMPDPI